ncbi:three-helix bundle dimerization domain-containing protein [Arthrobacter crystallopoietes]|uniref:Arsenate reductase n=1 Tax=Crystallibacter crystallopoietes TaxID=37928 RepID=A0A1H1G1R7_9MICC|nr:phosphatase [Arthrobacter crystallopoietes]AUI52828.1 phosphatase [Arthrobacter crystallopoietes]SDR06796.1 arsenate reductase [Arthrobacter crystallopoietes]
MDNEHGTRANGLNHAEHVLGRISRELAAKFDGVFTAEMVDRYVFESYTALARTARIKTYLPSITRHFAYDRLTALAHSQGTRPSGKPEVLFVCVQNAGRSQMAAALLKHHAGETVNVRSAGSMPAEHLVPNVTAVMNDLGINLEHEFPKPLTDDVVRAADVVVTMGCGDACPIYPGKRYEDWKIDDPDGRTLQEVLTIRDQLDRRVKELFAGLPA